jgi:hypothetical protein
MTRPEPEPYPHVQCSFCDLHMWDGPLVVQMLPCQRTLHGVTQRNCIQVLLRSQLRPSYRGATETRRLKLIVRIRIRNSWGVDVAQAVEARRNY